MDKVREKFTKGIILSIDLDDIKENTSYASGRSWRSTGEIAPAISA